MKASEKFYTACFELSGKLELPGGSYCVVFYDNNLVTMRSYWSFIILGLCIQLVRGRIDPEAWGEEGEDGDEIIASRYFRSLTEKHGAKLKLEAERLIEDPQIELEQAKVREDDDRVWHVGEVSLTQVDKSSVSSLVRRLDSICRLPWKMLIRSHLTDLGLFFLSVTDTNVFEEL